MEPFVNKKQVKYLLEVRAILQYVNILNDMNNNDVTFKVTFLNLGKFGINPKAGLENISFISFIHSFILHFFGRVFCLFQGNFVYPAVGKILSTGVDNTGQVPCTRRHTRPHHNITNTQAYLNPTGMINRSRRHIH